MRNRRILAVFLAGAASLTVTAGAAQATPTERATQAAPKRCTATWYGKKGEFPPGAHTANGDKFDRFAMTAANNKLPFGTKVKVSYGKKSVTVRINDRGSFHDPVCLDLTYGAFGKIADRDKGMIKVKYQVLD
ncbi:septal ring lytic transglycosylase RlpA family protein [Sciscionella marina]|uniref:septal ring lytic transglycosylase RlpA family protein n=1 Tax=Sciscionella marina TaxID=508770 RepID=UPI00035EAB93|nr:septal ring lytic transglycosylase RlpA family protein [Sciscionella marina]